MSKAVSAQEWDYYKNEYDYYPNPDDCSMPERCKYYHDWQKVYKEGCDSKYGTIMVSNAMRAWRYPTMAEFYGGSSCWD